MEKIPDEVVRQIIIASEERYEINGSHTVQGADKQYERRQCFNIGASFGYSLASKALSDANKEIERLKGLVEAQWGLRYGGSHWAQSTLEEKWHQFAKQNNL